MSKNDRQQTIGAALAAMAILVGAGLIAAATLIIWALIRQRWNWAILGFSTSLLFLGVDLFVAGCTRKKPQVIEVLSSLI